jgi:hypothetical protein
VRTCTRAARPWPSPARHRSAAVAAPSLLAASPC